MLPQIQSIWKFDEACIMDFYNFWEKYTPVLMIHLAVPISKVCHSVSYQKFMEILEKKILLKVQISVFLRPILTQK